MLKGIPKSDLETGASRVPAMLVLRSDFVECVPSSVVSHPNPLLNGFMVPVLTKKQKTGYPDYAKVTGDGLLL